MKVAHFVHFAPHRCGLFGTARDLVLAERKAGIDAQVVDWGNGLKPEHSRVGLKDDESDIITVAPSWAYDADVLVRHSAIPKDVLDKHKPIVMCHHAAPSYSFMLEHSGKTRSLAESAESVKQNPDYKVQVTFWEDHVFPWQVLVPNIPVEYCPAPVDLDYFKPEGEKYSFKGSDKFNIVISDMWRKEYSAPFDVLFAAAKFIKEKCPDGKITVFGLPKDLDKYKNNSGPVNRTMLALKKAGYVNECFRLVKNIGDVYRGADMLVTQHTVASRTVREALACGCPVVGASGNVFTQYAADPKNIDSFVQAIKFCYSDIKHDRSGVREAAREAAREMAEYSFNFDMVGQAMKSIFEKIL